MSKLLENIKSEKISINVITLDGSNYKDVVVTGFDDVFVVLKDKDTKDIVIIVAIHAIREITYNRLEGIF